MRSVQSGFLAKSTRFAAVALALHVLLLVVDWLSFAAAYSELNGRTFWPILRIVAFGLVLWGLFRQESSRRLVGFMACVFLLGDLTSLGAGEIPIGPALTNAQGLLTASLLLSLAVGTAALWWPDIRPIFRTPAA
jgi:hypothetical protein